MAHRTSSLLFAVIFSILFFERVSLADVITLTSGRTIQGTVIQKDSDNILILADYGTTSVPANIVESIKSEIGKSPATLSKNSATSAGRLPEWKAVITKLASQGWADKLRQIPATVITNGILKNVPYISFRCGVDYEMNIYGDLDNPAGIELGFYRSLLSREKREYAAGNVIQFLAAILSQADDKRVVEKLDFKKDKQLREDFVFEVTPETAEDSYGGWWVSVYCEKALDQARVSDKELADISILNSAIIKEPEPVDSGISWNRNDLKYARTVSMVPQAAIAQSVSQSVSSPTIPVSTIHTDVAPENNHGSVYVKGYYRKDGTYVRPYTRRR